MVVHNERINETKAIRTVTFHCSSELYVVWLKVLQYSVITLKFRVNEGNCY